MRGEDGFEVRDTIAWLGSPPHARGRHAALPRSTGTPRITPACAGKTREQFIGNVPGLDHPRMRGEDAPVLLGQQRVG